ncbi:hypothetical protein DCW30_00125 [Streptomyces alfalfae]|uniref:SH3 domain-containing protein n=1 Tax=Streptomyces alfalfae TaxID=1642299 RepID=A0ABN4VK92_9ACTN|nr:hypothetical protein [Streptomyces alfalfae]APY86208.1 hypothetical protein A7J05_11250 [Streptomyces alfalfae]AYA16588.1 hypothetical protein D3X13_10455 [Streptomyces fradiae]RXX48301.1 hypothetical protein DCW30_00125 [Streptomyces alfalfae]RZM91044.1 hypothetical protein D4104_23940 [Streptomyces alfalfae]
MKFRKFAAGAVAVSALALVGTTVTAGAAAAATKPDCSRGLTNVPAKETVKVRKTAKVSGTAVGQINKGRKAFLCNDGKSFKGQTYTLCGKKSSEWLYVDPNNGRFRGYVPRACMKW